MDNSNEPKHAGSSVQTSDTTSSPSQFAHSAPVFVKHCRVRNRKPVLHVAEHVETVQLVHEQYGHGSRIQSNICVSCCKPAVSQHVLQLAVVLVMQFLV